MESYTTVLNVSRFEYEDRKSVFIGACSPVKTEEEALNFIASLKKEFPDARHHVYAYVLRENSIMRFTDDREPQGTAGMPVLDAIRKNGLTDAVVVVVRYFGGTLLGTGGLVKAYSTAATGALRAANIITYDIYTSLKIELSYSDYQKVLPMLEAASFRIEATDYAENVLVSGKIIKSGVESLVSDITESTSGRAGVEILGDKFDY